MMCGFGYYYELDGTKGGGLGLESIGLEQKAERSDLNLFIRRVISSNFGVIVLPGLLSLGLHRICKPSKSTKKPWK